MNRPIPIGLDDFRKLREGGMEYVDKTQLIGEILDLGAEVLLLPRPRRFGKTLNLSMLRCFFEKRDEDLSALFADLRVWQAGDDVRKHFQRYPVIHLTFKGVKLDTYDLCFRAIKAKIEALFDAHRYLLDTGRLSEREAAEYREILARTAEVDVYARSLADLSRHLHRQHGERVLILIDEYDEPIHAGHVNGYAPQVLQFLRAFLTEGLKGNEHLWKGVLTGVLRIAKETSRTESAPLRTPLRSAELRLRGPDSVLPVAPSESIFSGLNNLAVYTLLRPELGTCFGFTEPEVAALLEGAGRRDQQGAVRAWYNGYVFGGTVVYNPWSILNFVASEDTRLRGYWLSTSANDLIHEQLQHHALRAQDEITALLEGGHIEMRLDENVVLTDLARRPAALWSLLVFSGYLKAEDAPGPLDDEPRYRLSIPNREVREVFTSTFREQMASRLLGHGGDVGRLTAALLGGDAEALEEQLQAFTTNLLSFHDTALRPEQVYHAFVIGLLATLEPEYEVRSNRESGQGRPDVTIRPRAPGRPGVVLELKVARPGRKTPEKALDEGLSQIAERDYGAELRAAGAAPVHAFAVAFDGKRVWVKSANG